MRNRKSVSLLLVLAILLVAGCATAPPAPGPELTAYQKAQVRYVYLEGLYAAQLRDATSMGATGDATDHYQQAVQIVIRDKKATTSYIQRRLQIGYNRAASIMERMEQEGIVGQANHAGKREILAGAEEHERY